LRIVKELKNGSGVRYVSSEQKAGIFDDGAKSLEAWLAERGERPFRAKQVRQWVISRRVSEFEQMTDLPKELRAALAEEWTVFSTRVVRESVAEDGTTKLLLGLRDGHTVECVLIPEEKRRTICLSTQVGCGMGCVFCASGLNGVERNLTPGEMTEQLLQLNRRLHEEDRVNHIVVMGMGEPLANLESLLKVLTMATSLKDGLGISARNITISTVGLPAKIKRLSREGKQYHLAVSLHAPNNKLRQEIVPMAEKVELEDILEAADEFREKTGRQVTFEYVLLGGINDDVTHARQLVRLMGMRDAMINLIPYNSVSGLPFKTPASERTNVFAETLRQAGLVVKVRKRKGSNIDAACGQLRRSHEQVVSINMDGNSSS
jgi:23S rRNA (adenine2503-C2)-methyltransferase